MLDWIVRFVTHLSGVVAGWLVSPDGIKFGIVQMGVTLILVTALIALAAFWPVVWASSKRGVDLDRNSDEGSAADHRKRGIQP